MWSVCCPVWGEPYRTIFTKATLPAALIALDEAKVEARFLVFTDESFDPALFGGHEVESHPVPIVQSRRPPRWAPYPSLSEAHNRTLKSAENGTRVLLLNADIVCSREAIVFAESVFAEDKKAVATLGFRSLWWDCSPVGMSARDLLQWCWDNHHPIHEDCVWGRGRSTNPTTIFFEDGENVVAHGFYLYPLMLVKDRAFSFTTTIDNSLMQNYSREEVYSTTEREVGFAELTGPERSVPSGEPLSVEFMAKKFLKSCGRVHRENFAMPIRIAGDGTVTPGQEVVKEILGKMG